MQLCVQLEELGWNEWFAGHAATAAAAVEAGDFARVAAEGGGLYRVLGASGEALAELSGRLRHAASDRGELPAVGDWVALRAAGAGRGAIREVLPRRTALSRKAAGRESAVQVLAANVDVVFVVTSLNRDLNPRRLERYLAVAWESGARPVVVLAKADLVADPGEAVAAVRPLAPGAAVLAASVRDGTGIAEIAGLLGRGKTGVFVGSSGAGKSSLINALLAADGSVPSAAYRPVPSAVDCPVPSAADRPVLPVPGCPPAPAPDCPLPAAVGAPERPAAVRQATGAIRDSDDRGRHTTTARQLLSLPGGGLVIDTPGLRELQLWEGETGMARAFPDVEAHARACRFRDCRHRGEPGCAVEQAVRAGDLASDRVASHHKLMRELAALAARTDPRRRIEERARIKRLTRAHRRRDPWE